MVYYYAKEECGYNVVAFTVDRKYIEKDTFHGKPLISFEEVEKLHSPEQHAMFVAIGYQDMNRLREQKYNAVINLGYDIINGSDRNC